MKTKAAVALALTIGTLVVIGGEIGGVGIELAAKEKGQPVKINRLIPGGPAAKAGIQPGSLLVSVNGTNTVGISRSQCVALVRGKEGTQVVLEVADSGRTNKITLTRDKIILTDPVSKQSFRRSCVLVR